ncbi:MAG: hypothetical protein ACR2HV_06215 [Acidimicrobiales bacterium]
MATSIAERGTSPEPGTTRTTLTGIRTWSPSRFLAAAAASFIVVVALGACRDDNAPNKALVKAVNLTRADVPPEWAESPRRDPVGEDGDDSRYAACVGRPDPKNERTADADSVEYHLEDRLRAMSSAQTQPSVEEAVADLAAQRADRGLSCLRQRFKGQLNRNSTGGDAPESFTVQRIPDVGVGDESVAFRAELVYPSKNGNQPKAYIDVVTVRTGRAETVFTLFSAGQPFPADLARDLMTKVVARASPGT